MHDAATFQALVDDLDAPMFIVTTRVGDERVGCLVGFATQASIDPPRFVVCLSHTNHTYRAARDARLLAVHWVPAEAAALAQLFGGETGDRVDKFTRCRWSDGPGGLPILDECPNWFVGRIVSRSDAGDHDALLLEPVAARRIAARRPFTLRQAAEIEPGHRA